MKTIEKEELIARLVEEFELSQTVAEFTADDLLNMHDSLQAGFQEWWHTGDIPDEEVEGYSVNNLMTEYQMLPFAAMLTLDWLIHEPDEAKNALARGYDEVIIDD